MWMDLEITGARTIVECESQFGCKYLEYHRERWGFCRFDRVWNGEFFLDRENGSYYYRGRIVSIVL